MNADYIYTFADPQAALETVGGKGASLARLAAAGLPVPGGFHITTAAYTHFVSHNHLQPQITQILDAVDVHQPETLTRASTAIQQQFAAGNIPEDIGAAIKAAYETLPGNTPPVAVRSSATAEDLPDLSFAGQQESFLNICGSDAVLAAVKHCWASLWTARAIGYRIKNGIDQEAVKLAVVVQLLVNADASGVLFTANPLSGARDQAMISATWGLGEALVGGTVTPDTVVVSKTDHRILTRETAVKQIQTVRVNGGTQDIPVPASQQEKPVLTDQQAAELSRLGAEIEALYSMPMDIEWAIAQGQFAIVQARPITALPAPEPPAPSEWKLPPGQTRALRNNIVELMADPLTPLFETLGRRAINRSLSQLMTHFMGSRDILPGELIISVNHYAYYNGTFTPKQIFQILGQSVGIFRRMFTGIEARTSAARPLYTAAIAHYAALPWRTQPAEEILANAGALMEAAITYYGALLGGVIPAAWMTEGLFTATYKLLVKRKFDPDAPVFLLGYDSLPILAEKSLYDLAVWARLRPALADYLGRTPAGQLAAELTSGGPADIEAEIWETWQTRFQAYLEQFGHMIYNLDFANPIPASDPLPLLEALKLFVRGEGTNPHERQSAASQRREHAVQTILARLGKLRTRLFRKTLETAQRYAPLREDGLADIGLAYPLIREMLLELGKRFTHAGMLPTAADIFWLQEAETADAAARVDRGESLENLGPVIAERKAAIRAARRAAAPLMLPQMILFGKDLASLKTKRAKGNVLKGVAASPGQVTATARVLHGPEDFNQMRPGDVLVAAITTPAWTPLFAMASAVVTNVGGPLSHGSIVAREYGIPAVLGTGEATSRIQNGQQVTVDGSTGQVFLSTNGRQ